MSEDIKNYENKILAYTGKELDIYKSECEQVSQEVHFSIDSPVFEEYISTIIDEVSARLYDVGGAISTMVRSGEFDVYFRRYLATLLENRIAHSQNLRGAREIITWRDRVWIPSFFYVIMNQIGQCVDETLQVKYTARYVPSSDYPLLSRDECLKFGSQLFGLEKFGFVGANNLPKNKDGDIGFMSFNIISGIVMRHDDHAPEVKALLFSVLAMESVSFVLTPRVSYGYVKRMSHNVRRFAKPND